MKMRKSIINIELAVGDDDRLSPVFAEMDTGQRRATAEVSCGKAKILGLGLESPNKDRWRRNKGGGASHLGGGGGAKEEGGRNAGGAKKERSRSEGGAKEE